MNRTVTLFALVALAAAAPFPLHAQELVFTFNNPSFGGSPFNGSNLLAEAQAQNGFTSKSALPASSYTTDPLANFKQSINQQILSQLSRQLIAKAFGENGQVKNGHYELGDFNVDITQTTDGISIDITDIKTGGVTNIVIPFY